MEMGIIEKISSVQIAIYEATRLLDHYIDAMGSASGDIAAARAKLAKADKLFTFSDPE